MLRVVVKLNMPGKIPKIEEEEPILRWLENTDSHLKKSSERNVWRIHNIEGHLFIDQLKIILV